MDVAPILIVDDDPQDRELTQVALRRLPLKAPLVFLTSGADFKDYLEGLGPYANRVLYPYPSVTLLDLEMPKGGGIEALEWLKGQPRHAALPIIALSGKRDAAKVTQAYSLGARSFLTKPIDVKDFQSVVKSLKITI